MAAWARHGGFPATGLEPRRVKAAVQMRLWGNVRWIVLVSLGFASLCILSGCFPIGLNLWVIAILSGDLRISALVRGHIRLKGRICE
mgnify:CR=1 FL=1